MDSLEQKLDEIELLLKSFGDLNPQLNFSQPKAMTKPPKEAGRPRGPGIPRQTMGSTPKIPGLPNPSKKNPVEIAQHSPGPDKDAVSAKVTQAKEGLAFNPGGQWKLKKAE